MPPHCQKQVAEEGIGATEPSSRTSLRYLDSNRNENLYVINDFYQVCGPERLLLYSREGNGFLPREKSIVVSLIYKFLLKDFSYVFQEIDFYS